MQNSGNNRAESTRLCKNRAFCFFTHPEPPGNSRTFDCLCYDLTLGADLSSQPRSLMLFLYRAQNAHRRQLGGSVHALGGRLPRVMWATARRCAVALGHSMNRFSVVPGQGGLGM